MARLNEPPAATAPTTTALQPATESVDAVKRRFVRQNRDLAKSNSVQSLRIRTLELDVSRLLAENLDLRNRVLRLQNEVYTSQSRASTTAVVRKVKRELQVKIGELSGIVDGIEDDDEDDVRVDEGREGGRERKKPLEGNWRERQPLSELMRDGQMPTIVEDKLYPRRTLGTGEMQAIRLSDRSSNESPDLGPPPVARLEDEDPGKNCSPLVDKVSSDAVAAGEYDELPASLSVNLETRRKRKDGQPRLQIRRHSLLPQSPAKGESEASTMLRTGAKRKLADREGEKGIKPPGKGDFTFSRKSTAEDARTTSEPARSATEKRENAEQLADQVIPSPKPPARKVLGDKSVNTSPRKPVPKTEKNKPERENFNNNPNPPHPTNNSKETTSTRRRRISSIPLPTPQDEEPEILSTIELAPPPQTDPPPQTPAEPDLFSPTPSEPSTLREEPGRGDTPPPGDLSTISTTDGGGGVRPSRRARAAAVNYAEPSLISKMRRPDKKMVDAVKGLQDHRRVMSGFGEREAASAPASAEASRVVVIKKEPVEDEDDEGDGWKDLPPAYSNLPVEASSFLTQKSGGEDLSSTPPAPATANERPVSTSSATISALMAAGRKQRRESGQQQPPARPVSELVGTDIETAAKKLEELDLYEFKESSSPLLASSDSGKVPIPPVRSKSQRRRHSVVPKSDVVGGDGGGLGREGRAERGASRRRSMLL